MPLVVRRHAKTCSTRCRVARHRAHTIPKPLTSRERWVRHSARKAPLTTAGKAASSTDSTTWSTHAEVKRSTSGVGIGFVLNGDGIVCLDLDHCISGKNLDPAVAQLLRSLPDTYIEISPSGHGLHVWGRGHLPAGRRTKVDGVPVEAYGTGRYITVTGKRWSKTNTLADLSGVLARL